ncbi:hypothetical protein HPB47_013669 [Ixodes persulcatus]|uniref:Uncharacterized protein n=1 Tax=Ixodes persulcatus TaxID=34615 RepID=A0AC60QXX5_IXOPE|nr:hypothetical protein HPB47_013669 [Ixodes persulcatus]
MKLQELIACGKEIEPKGSALKEWEDQERERSIEAEQKERAARAQDLELRIRLQELQNAAPIPVNATPADNGTGTMLWKSPQRWLPTFGEKKEDLDAYLVRFEGLARGKMLPREH